MSGGSEMRAAAIDYKPKIALGVIALIAVVFAVLLIVYGGQIGVAESPRPLPRYHQQAARPVTSTPVATVTSTTEGMVIMSGDVLSNEQLMQSGGTLSV
jgi:hypothetical protein